MKKIISIIAMSVALISVFAFSSLAAVESVDGWNSYTTADYLEVRSFSESYYFGENVSIPFTFNSSSLGVIEAPHFEVYLNMGNSGFIDVPAGYTVQIQMDYFCASTTSLPLSAQYCKFSFSSDSVSTDFSGTVELAENGYDYIGKISWQNNTGSTQQIADFYFGMKPTTLYMGMYSFNLYALKYRVLSPEQAAQDVYLNWTPEPQLPDGSASLDEMESMEDELFSDAGEADATLDEFAASGLLLFQGFAGEFAVISMMITKILTAVPGFQNILYVSITLGVFGMLTGLGIHLLSKAQYSSSKPKSEKKDS